MRLICPCGHVAEPNLKELWAALDKRGGYRLDLAGLKDELKCGQCGGKSFSYETIQRADKSDDLIKRHRKELDKG